RVPLTFACRKSYRLVVDYGALPSMGPSTVSKRRTAGTSTRKPDGRFNANDGGRTMEVSVKSTSILGAGRDDSGSSMRSAGDDRVEAYADRAEMGPLSKSIRPE
ncbi:MAG TPA: hypothetical protein VGL96_06460, partial [Casimicrobiaceae bacterium]